MSQTWTGFIKELLFGKYAYMCCAIKYVVVFLPLVVGAESFQQAVTASRPAFVFLALDLAYFSVAGFFLNHGPKMLPGFVRLRGSL